VTSTSLVADGQASDQATDQRRCVLGLVRSRQSSVIIVVVVVIIDQVER
jgi:hypothetical protein